ncbi:MAG: ferritin Dps family protein [Rhizobacter sp.]
MDHQTSLGHNRTGIQMSPVDSARMKAGADETPMDGADPQDYVRVRQGYIDDKGLGTVPPPGTLKGVASSGVEMLTGKRPQTLVDKLGERLAFERGGVRLYDSLLAKCEGSPDSVPDEAIRQLRRFRDEEVQHLRLVITAIESLGADPTAQTPCADLVGVESMGLVQAMNDPRTNVLQSLHVMLDAEVLDNAAWDMLVELARATGHDDLADGFAIAVQQEADHLIHLRALVSRLTLADAHAGSPNAASMDTASEAH